MEASSFSPLSGDRQLPLCAKPKINLSRTIFQSKPNDFWMCAKRRMAFGQTFTWHGLKDRRLKVQDVPGLFWMGYGVFWKMKDISGKRYGGIKPWGYRSRQPSIFGGSSPLPYQHFCKKSWMKAKTSSNIDIYVHNDLITSSILPAKTFRSKSVAIFRPPCLHNI